MLNVVVWFSFKGVFNCWIWSSSHTRVKIKNACIMPKREPGYYISIREDFLQQACSQFWHCQFWRQKVKEKYPTDWLNKAMELDCSNWHIMNIEDPPEHFVWKCQCLVPKVVFCLSYVVHTFFWCSLKKNKVDIDPFDLSRKSVESIFDVFWYLNDINLIFILYWLKFLLTP